MQMLGRMQEKKNRKVEQYEKGQESPQAEIQEWQESAGVLTETYAAANTLLRPVKQESKDSAQSSQSNCPLELLVLINISCFRVQKIVPEPWLQHSQSKNTQVQFQTVRPLRRYICNKRRVIPGCCSCLMNLVLAAGFLPLLCYMNVMQIEQGL